MSQALGADAAIYLAVTTILGADPEWAMRSPGGLHPIRIPAGGELPATAWNTKSSIKDHGLAGVISQIVPFWFKVNTEAPYAGEAAVARLRFHFDGTEVANFQRIKAELEPLLRPRGWHLQGCYEETPIPLSDEPVGNDYTTLRYAQGSLFYAKVQPIPAQ